MSRLSQTLRGLVRGHSLRTTSSASRPAVGAIARATATVLESLERRTLMSAGALDTSWGGTGVVSTNFPGAASDVAHDMTTLSNGDLLALGTSDGTIVLTKYDPAGHIFSSWGNAGRVTITPSQLGSASELALDDAGRIIVAGASSAGKISVLRLNANGTTDAGFGSGGVATLNRAGSATADVA